MKLSSFIQVAVVLALIALAAIGCASSRNFPDSRRYPYPDSRRYPGGDRTIIIVPDRLPPGHAKKIYGDRSARRHAPGHNKRYDDRRYDDKRYDNRRNDRERYSGKYDKKYEKYKKGKNSK